MIPGGECWIHIRNSRQMWVVLKLLKHWQQQTKNALSWCNGTHVDPDHDCNDERQGFLYLRERNAYTIWLEWHCTDNDVPDSNLHLPIYNVNTYASVMNSYLAACRLQLCSPAKLREELEKRGEIQSLNYDASTLLTLL